MKKTFYISILCLVLSAANAQAQSLNDLLSGISNLFGSSEEAAPQPKITHPEIYDLLGVWKFDGLVMDYTGDSSVAAVAISTLESQLPTIATKFGIVAGRDYIDVSDDGTLTFVCGEARMTAQCTYYDSYDGEASMTFYIDGKSVYTTATILEQGGVTKVLFNANKLMEILAKHYSKFNENTTLQMAKAVIDSYPGIRVGAKIKR